MMNAQRTKNWSLEVVRGKDVGRSYAINGRAIVLGNAIADEPGINLADQEGTAPRRMAAKQAQLEYSPQGLVLRDLDSPGGTFVNRQRILPGQGRPLRSGDLIQLGGVQLKVVEASSTSNARTAAVAPPPVSTAPPANKTGPLPAPFTLASGATCRTWDDFLTVAAQRWSAMREELTSGRLGAFLVSVQRADLVPSPGVPGTPDERLDAWLGALPTTRPSRPELEVHPQTLPVRVASGGGVTRRTIQVTNTGYRLLRTNVRVEPANTNWLKVAPEFAGGPFVTIEQTEFALEVEIPETLDRPLSAALVFESNGGNRRVEVRLERATAGAEIPAGVPMSIAAIDLSTIVSRTPAPVRIALGALAGLLLRLLVAAGGLVGGGASSTGAVRIPLRGALIVMALTGGALAAWRASRRGEPRDIAPAGMAGAVAGALASAVMVALVRSVEPTFVTSSTLFAAVVWSALGGALAAVSARFIPYQPSTEDRP
jgi:hypothetical protein